MASSSKETASSSSSSPQWKYSVFLNFRGKDTRKGFVSHLYDALVEQGIPTFKDDKEPEIGNEFPPGLMEAIDGSRIFVVVISPNYASSSWCLNELVKIMECRDKGIGQTVIPVFYNVDPSHVRKQEGTFATAIANHRNSSKERMWRDALTKVATISGLDSLEGVDEATLVKDLVKKISDILWDTSTSDMDGLVGIDKHLEEMSLLLCPESSDVRWVGICGMGGIGKTTIARAVYDRVPRHFEGKCFLLNVKENVRKNGVATVRKELLSQIFMETNLSVRVLDGSSNTVKERLRHKRSIIVLDDVDNLEQLQILPQRCDWFGLGSRIIVTTRDKQLLIAHGVRHIYEVKGLENGDALQLFNQYAFRGDPIPNEYSELCEHVMFYAKGLPLALKVLGSFLCGRRKREWESAFKKLESIPNPDVHKVLKVTYDDLDDKEKDIFLDIACFFNWQSKDRVIEFLDSCGFHPKIGIPVLIEKSLLTVFCKTPEMDETLEMHDLLQEMGREIIRQESIKNPNKRSRLWIPDDIQRVLTNNMGSEKVEGILLDLSESKAMDLGASTFAAMCNLRFLKFHYENRFYSEDFEECKVNLPNGLESLPDELRYLHWHGYPLTSLPHNFSPDKLGVLSLPHSNIEQLPRDIYKLKSLREINLFGCGNLRSFLEISEPMDCLSSLVEFCLPRNSIEQLPSSICQLKSLRTINLSNCGNLRSFPEISEPMDCLHTLDLDRTGIEELHPSIENLTGLRNLYLQDCKNLEHLPGSICGLKSLRDINLSYCGNLRSFPEISEPMHCLESLVLQGTGIKELHPSIENLTGLRNLYLQDCKNLEHLPSSIYKLKSLREIDLSDCGNLRSFPEISEPMDCLSSLKLKNTGIRELHPSIENLTGLQDLDIRWCKNLERLPSSIWSLESLKSLLLIGCPNLNGLPTPIISSKLKFLDEIWLCDCVNLRSFPEISEPMNWLSWLTLSGTGIKELHPSIEHLTGLIYLELENCENLERLPTSFWSLKSLDELRLSDCPNLRALPPIPTSGNSSSVPVDDQTPHQFSSLEILELKRNNNFEELPENIKELSNLKVLELSGCRKLKSLPELPLSLTSMVAENCISLETVSTSGDSISPEGGSHFSYAGCFKLSREAQSNIVENFLQQTQYTGPPFDEFESAYLDMIHGHKVTHKSRTGITVYIPGSEIPEFFSYQSTGSFLTADLPRDWNNSDFMGFAMCAVFEFIGFDSEEDTSEDVDRMNSDDDNFLVHCLLSLSIDYSYPSSDHIVMGYDANLASKIGGDEQLKSSNFSFKFTIGSEFRVKKCGVGLIYKNAQGKKGEA